MNMRTTFDHTTRDPYDDDNIPSATLVDKFIGNAYHIVRYVARHLDAVRYVAANMEIINTVAEGMKTNALAVGLTGNAGETVVAPLPTGVTAAMVLSSSVIVVGADGTLYSSDSGYFSAVIQGGALQLTLKGAAPANVEGAVFRWFLTYGVA